MFFVVVSGWEGITILNDPDVDDDAEDGGVGGGPDGELGAGEADTRALAFELTIALGGERGLFLIIWGGGGGGCCWANRLTAAATAVDDDEDDVDGDDDEGKEIGVNMENEGMTAVEGRPCSPSQP